MTWLASALSSTLVLIMGINISVRNDTFVVVSVMLWEPAHSLSNMEKSGNLIGNGK